MDGNYHCTYYAGIRRLVCTPIRRRGARTTSGSSGLQPTEPKRSRRQAASRAAREVRILVHHFELTQLWTLTYTNAPDTLKALNADISRMGRRLRSAGVRQRLAVPEQGSGRWHVHLATSQLVEGDTMQRAWPQGLVWPPDRVLQGQGTAAAVAEYLVKEFHQPPSRRRYMATRSLTTPEPRRFTALDLPDALQQASQYAGGTYVDHYSTQFNVIFDF